MKVIQKCVHKLVFKMHMLYQFQQETSILKTNLCTHFQITFIKVEKYSAQIASHQAELRREEKFTDQKSLDVYSLQTDYLNLDTSTGSIRHSEIAYFLRQSAHFVQVIIILRKNVLKGLDRKREKLARLMFHLKEIWNVHLGNALDVDLKIT